MGPWIRCDARTAKIYASGLRVCSALQPKWLKDIRNSPRRAGPSFHPYMLHMLSLCCKTFKIQICSAQNIGKVWINGKIPVAPFGPFQVNFQRTGLIIFFERSRKCQVEINHTTLDSFSDSKMWQTMQRFTNGGGCGTFFLLMFWVWLIIHNIQSEHYDLLSSWHVVCGS